MLGAYQSIFRDLEGIDPADPRSNRDKDGEVYFQTETAATSVLHDPMHELANVLHQLENANGNFVAGRSVRVARTDGAAELIVHCMNGLDLRRLPAIRKLESSA